MECQNITKKLKINKEKSIGEVVVVVEGESEEFRLLKHIFVELFDYNYITYKRKRGITDVLKSKTNKNSTIIVANTSSSSMKSIFEDEDFEDKIYNLIMKDYNKSLKNVPVYILWDRDKGNNTKEMAIRGIEVYRNSQDNNYGMNGIFLISYPCIESYELSNFNKQAYLLKFESSVKAKKTISSNAKRYSLNNISETTIINAAKNMHRSFMDMNISKYDPSNFFEVNKKIFMEEETTFELNKYYKVLSLVTVMLVDLGIIYEE